MTRYYKGQGRIDNSGPWHDDNICLVVNDLPGESAPYGMKEVVQDLHLHGSIDNAAIENMIRDTA